MNNTDMILKHSKNSDYQLLMMKQLLPILLYIRNFSEYNRHRPAEARLSARRRARAEQIEFRMKELERQHKKMISNTPYYSDRHYHLFSSNNNNNNNTRSAATNTNATKVNDYYEESQCSSYTASRRSSEHSLDESVVSSFQEKDATLNELEDKYKKSMIKNSQLENDIRSYSYQIELYKDIMEELEENFIRQQMDTKEKSRSYDQLKRDYKRLEEENDNVKEILRQREALITDAGLVIIDSYEINLLDPKRRQSFSDESGSESGISESITAFRNFNNASLVSQEAWQQLSSVDGYSLEAKLKTLFVEKRLMQNEITRLKSELDAGKQRTTELEELTVVLGSYQSISSSEAKIDAQREASKLVSDYRSKIEKCHEVICDLQASQVRYESKISRHQISAERAEKFEEEIRADKRKLQRELKEAFRKIEDLEATNVHLQKRIDKLKTS